MPRLSGENRFEIRHLGRIYGQEEEKKKLVKPVSVSASSLNNWFSCQAMFAAANLEKVPEYGEKNAANVGTAVHYPLEKFVEEVFMKRVTEWEDLPRLLELYEEGFLKTFGHLDRRCDEYKDGLTLVKKWHSRTDLRGWQILSVEAYRQHPIANTGVKLTYIFDRIQCQVTPDGRTILKVVDYKTIRRTYSHEQLSKMLQMRLYALAAAIQAKNEGWAPDEIWVELDLLRHEPVGIMVTREENEETWNLLLKTVGLILATDPADAQRKLNANCKYCPIAASCPALAKHIAAGGVLGLSIEEMVRKYHDLTSQLGGIEGVLAQLEGLIKDHSLRIGESRFTVDGFPVTISAGSRRGLRDPAEAARIIGPELMQLFGELKIGDVDKLLDGDRINEEQKNQLRRLITRNPTKQSLKVGDPQPLAKEK